MIDTLHLVWFEHAVPTSIYMVMAIACCVIWLLRNTLLARDADPTPAGARCEHEERMRKLGPAACHRVPCAITRHHGPPPNTALNPACSEREEMRRKLGLTDEAGTGTADEVLGKCCLQPGTTLSPDSKCEFAAEQWQVKGAEGVPGDGLGACLRAVTD